MRTLFSKSYKIKMERGRQRLDAAAGFFNLVAVLRGSADLVFPALRAPRHANQGMWEAHYFSGGGGWRAAVGQGRRAPVVLSRRSRARSTRQRDWSAGAWHGGPVGAVMGSKVGRWYREGSTPCTPMFAARETSAHECSARGPRAQQHGSRPARARRGWCSVHGCGGQAAGAREGRACTWACEFSMSVGG